MDERATGLILRTRPFTETSLIVNWLTLEAGRIATVARGARRPKSPFRGKVDLYFLGELQFVRSRRSDLHTLREVRLLETHQPLRRELPLLQQAAYAANLVERTTECDTPVPEVYELLSGFLQALAAHTFRPEMILWFELKHLSLLGLQPDLNSAGLSPRTRVLARGVFSADWAQLAGTRPDAGQVKELIHYLHGFLIYHLDRLPAGRAAALRETGAAPPG